MNTNHAIRAVRRSQGILQGEIVDYVFQSVLLLWVKKLAPF